MKREPAELLVFKCWTCRVAATACPGCVVSLLVDPATGLPPDVARSGNGFVHVDADPAAMARAVREPLCEACAARGGTTEPPEVRHARYCAL